MSSSGIPGTELSHAFVAGVRVASIRGATFVRYQYPSRLLDKGTSSLRRKAIDWGSTRLISGIRRTSLVASQFAHWARYRCVSDTSPQPSGGHPMDEPTVVQVVIDAGSP